MTWKKTTRKGGARAAGEGSPQWQRAGHRAPRQVVVAAGRRASLKLTVRLGLVGVLSALLLYFLAYAPKKTPLVAVVIDQYQWPVPPNAWSREDVQGLQELDGNNLQLTDLSPAWSDVPSGLAAMEQQLRRARRSDAIVLYISAQGAVDDAGRPCLIPAAVSPHRTSQWLPVETLLERISRQVPADHPKLLVMDCQRSTVNWQLGMVLNEFPETLAELIDTKSIPNLAVITSAGDGQTNPGSADLGGSPFGRFLQLGLAGVADTTEPLLGSAVTAVGNGDGQVSLHELHRFLWQETNRWSVANRGQAQQPQLLPPQAEDFPLVWGLDDATQRLLTAQTLDRNRRPPTVSPEDLGQLWNQLDNLRPSNPLHLAPLVWRKLEHQLLWLEQLAQAGQAYQSLAKRTFAKLLKQLDTTRELLQAPATKRSLPHAWAAWHASPQLVVSNLQLHTLPLAEFFGTAPVTTAESIRAELTRVAELDDPREARARIAAAPHAEQLRALAETQLVMAAQQYQVAQLWSQFDIVSETLQLRAEIEELAVPFQADRRPGDERAHYWVRQAMAQVDQSRRLVEDELFVGSRPGSQTAAEQVARARADLSQAAQIKEQAQRAVAIRDTAWAELGYLASWLCRPTQPLPAVQGTNTTDTIPPSQERVNSLLLPLMANVQQLGQVLAAHSATTGPDNTTSLPFLDLARQVQTDHALLKSYFEGTWQNLLHQGVPRPQALGEIESALAVPLIAWDQRVALLREHASLATRLHTKYLAQLNDASAPPAEPSTEMQLTAALAERMAHWNQHPLQALLAGGGEPIPDAAENADPSTRDLADQAGNGPDQGPPAASDWDRHDEDRSQIVQLQRELRQRLRALGSRARTSPGDNRTLAKIRLSVSASERRLRAAAPLWYEVPDENPIRRLREIDLQQLLLWHSARALTDFWADGFADRDRTLPFFARASRDYCQAAQQMGQPSAAVDALVSEQTARSAALTQVARDGLQITAESRPVADQAQACTISLQVETPGGFPSGRAALFVRGARGRETDWAVQAVRGPDKPLPQTQSPGIDEPGGPGSLTVPTARHERQRFQIHVADITHSSPKLDAVGLFRGHAYETPFLMHGLSGRVVDYVPHRHGAPTVTLYGEQRERLSVVFVLDCSASMEQLIRVESLLEDQLPRLELAKSALVTMLRELAARGDARVGVRFFGHRLGWSTDQPVRMLTQTDYLGEIPSYISPSNDVETVLTLGRFDSVDAGLVIRRLQSVQPWGQSPLYLSVAQALGDFDTDDDDTRKSIVVITDGKNYQFSPSGGESRDGLGETYADVVAAWNRQQVPVHILGFGVPTEERAAAEQGFNRIAEQTRGSYRSVRTGKDLLRVLRQRLGVGGYIVEDAWGNLLQVAADGTARPTRLNAPVALPNTFPQPQRCTVRFQSLSRTADVEPGVDWQLQVTSDASDLVAVPYRRAAVAVGSLVRGEAGPTAGQVLRARRPIRHGRDVRFPLSIQSQQAVYTQRPAESWVEITPLAGDPQVPLEKFIFYDANFESREPVPVLAWTALNWPAESDRALISYWAKDQPTPPIHTLPLEKMVRPGGNRYQPIPQVPGIRFRVSVSSDSERTGTYNINVIEEHDQRSAGIDTLKFSFQTPPEILPQRVTHRFDAANGIVTHAFVYDKSNQRAIVDSDLSRLTITRRADVLQGAWQLAGDRPLMVEVLDSNELFPPEAAAGMR